MKHLAHFAYLPLFILFVLWVLVWLFWSFSWLLSLCILALLFIYRKPNRVKICEDKKAILAPIDGQILSIVRVHHKDLGACVQIHIKNALYNAGGVFASCDFEIESVKTRHGLFLSPKFELSPSFNERIFIIAKNSFARFGMRLSAGSFDRYIKFYNQKNTCKSADELGFSINSTITLFLPQQICLLVGVGDEVRANSLLGYFS